MIKKLKWFNNDLFDTIKLGKKNLHKTPANRILTYHGIDTHGNTSLNGRFIGKDYFEKQLQWFSENCNLVSIENYFKGEYPKDRLTICLTFDDGYRNNFTLALPLLEKYKAPACFFITGISEIGDEMLWPDALDLASSLIEGRINLFDESFKKNRKKKWISETSGSNLKQISISKPNAWKQELMKQILISIDLSTNPEWREYWEQMTATEIRILSESSVATIGCHGYFHNPLDKISLGDASDELMRNKSYLEKVTGKKINDLAYPHGTYSLEVAALANSLGFTRQVVEHFNHLQDERNSFLRERLTMNPFISWYNQQLAIVKGKY